MGNLRVVIGLTTIPARYGTIGPTISSLQVQTRQPDEIRLYAGSACEPVDGVTLLHQNARGPIGELHDPITKMSAAIDPDLPPDTIVVTVDDDIIYHPQWLARLLAAAERHPREAVGMSGWNAFPFCEGVGTLPLVLPQAPCDILEGWAGVAYRRSFFDEDLMDYGEAFRWVDDVWISAYLRQRGVTRRVVRRSMSCSGPLPGLSSRPDFLELNRRAAWLGFA